MSKRELSCCFSGHRHSKLPWGLNENDKRCIELREEIYARLEGIYEAGYRHFICGMATGCDMYFAEAVLSLRLKHPEIHLEAAIPCISQADKWPADQQKRYRNILDNCDDISLLQHAYTRGCMMERNKYMVDNSSLLLSCFNGKPGGTMNTIVYAQRQDVKVIIIDI